MVTDPHFVARESIVTVNDAKLGPVRMQAPTPRLSASPGQVRFPGPRLGEHNDEIYKGLLGKSDGDIAALRAAGIV